VGRREAWSTATATPAARLRDEALDLERPLGIPVGRDVPGPSNTRDRPALADTTSAAAGCARKTVGLPDSTKFKRDSLMTARSAQSLDLIITNDGLTRQPSGTSARPG
jgi:hypothetical protein